MNVSGIINKDEEVLEVVHKHWINVVPLMGAFLLLSVVALVGVYMLGLHGGDVDASSKAADGLGLGALMALGLLLAYAAWWVYRENMLIVTNQNIYIITQNSLFSRNVVQFEQRRLQDVTADQSGVLATLLGYGSITLETAGEDENRAYTVVANAAGVAERMLAYHKQALAAPGNPSTD